MGSTPQVSNSHHRSLSELEQRLAFVSERAGRVSFNDNPCARQNYLMNLKESFVFQAKFSECSVCGLGKCTF